MLKEQQQEPTEENKEETVIGGDTSECWDKCTIVVYKIKARIDTPTPGGAC